MRIKISGIFISMFLLLFFACQKSDLKKDGYLILKANGKSMSLNCCVWSGNTQPGDYQRIFAYNRKDLLEFGPDSSAVDWKSDHLFITHVVSGTGTYTSTGNLISPDEFYADLVFKGCEYWMVDAEHHCNVIMEITRYDIDNGIIEGSITGTFYKPPGNDALEITNCSFSGTIQE